MSPTYLFVLAARYEYVENGGRSAERHRGAADQDQGAAHYGRRTSYIDCQGLSCSSLIMTTSTETERKRWKNSWAADGVTDGGQSELGKESEIA